MSIKTIRSRIMLYFIGGSAVIITVYGLFTFNMIRNKMEQEMENRLVTAGELIANTIKQDDIITFAGRGQVYAQYMKKMTRLKEITRARDILIIGDNRKIVLSTLGKQEKQFLNLNRSAIDRAFEGKVTSSPAYPGEGRKFYKTGYVPFVDDGEEMAVKWVIGIEAEADYVAYLEEYGRFIFFMGLLAVVFAMFLSFTVSRGITGRIEKLVKKANEIAKRNFSENISVEGGDEISQLAGNLDVMKLELKAYFEEREKMATVGEFSAGVAHEIRNSLGVISGYGELIREKTADEAIRKKADDIVKNTIKMNEFLNNFLAYTREFTPDWQDVSLSSLIDSLMEELPQEARKVAVKNYGPTQDKKRVDPYLLKKALYNIITNGWQALGPAGGRVEISIKEESGRSVITVKDNGRGMPENVKQRVFQPFVSGKKDGTGLGLAISYRIIKEIHGGDITVQSAGGTGTEVTITL
ncbi:MAG: HAMP domain-containing histidine kinase [Spirochaetia bacterium]|nr:HAMP domain-containing histidine kinase [Spirochaetia bacterium]